MMSANRVKKTGATIERCRRIYRQVKPRLQQIGMRVQTAGEVRYSPWPEAPSSESSEYIQ